MGGEGGGELPRARAAGFRPASLDAVNFLLADVRGALGPCLNVFLVTQRRWSQTEVGCVTTIAGPLGLVAQTPAGAMIDATRHERGAVVLALALLAAGAATILATPVFRPVPEASTVTAVVGDVFGPAVAAVTPLPIADPVRGTGRHNLARGAVATMQGVGASLSGLAAGVIVDRLGCSPAFLCLGGAACVALAALLFAMPETRAGRAGGRAERPRPGTRPRAHRVTRRPGRRVRTPSPRPRRSAA